MKKIIGLLLALSLMLTNVCAVGAYTDIEEGTSVSEAVTVLTDLNILEGFEDNTFKPNDDVTRAQMAKIICHMLDYTYLSTEKIIFSDVDPKHWAGGYINTAYGLGIIQGHGDGTFKPEDPVTYEEAVKMIVAALGYTNNYANNKGGYPTGYLVIGSESGITKGVALKAGQNANRGVIARLVYNALTAPTLVQNGYNSDGSFQYAVSEKATILDTKLDIEKVEAEIVSNSVNSDNGLVNEIKIRVKSEEHDRTVQVGETDIADYYGYVVDAYLAEDDNGKTFVKSFVIPSNRNTVAEIEDIKWVQPTAGVKYPSNDTTISVFDEDVDNTNTEYELADDYVVMYNGAKNTTIDIFDIDESGSMSLLDNNGDGAYDYVFVTTFKSDIIDDVYSNNTKISLETNGVIDLSKAINGKKGYSYSITLNGKAIDVEDLRTDDVISYSNDANGKHYTIYVSRKTVEGAIEELDTYENIYVINDDSYKAICGGTPDVGDEVLAYINVFNEIVKFDTTVIGSKKYGFITGAGIISTVGETEYEIQILTESNKLVTYTTDDEDIYNEVVANKGSDWIIKSNDVSESQLADYANRMVKYKVNSKGKLTSVSFVAPEIIPGAEYKKKLSSLNNYGISKNAIVFSTPISGNTVKADFEVGDASIFVNDDYYDVAVYDIENDINADYEIVLVVNSLASIGKDSSLAVVTKVMTTTNDKEDKVQNITFIQNGTIKTLMTVEELAVSVGDIFEYAVNVDGDISEIEIKDYSTYSTAIDNTLSSNVPQYVFGSVYAKSSDRIIQIANIDADGAAINATRHKISEDANFIYIDLTKSTPRASVASYGDIQTVYRDHENKVDFTEDEDRDISVLLKYYKDEIVDVVIIKGYNTID